MSNSFKRIYLSVCIGVNMAYQIIYNLPKTKDAQINIKYWAAAFFRVRRFLVDLYRGQVDTRANLLPIVKLWNSKIVHVFILRIAVYY